MLPTTPDPFHRLPCTSSFPLFGVKPGASKDGLQRPCRHVLSGLARHGDDHALLRMPELMVASPGRLQAPAIRFQHMHKISDLHSHRNAADYAKARLAAPRHWFPYPRRTRGILESWPIIPGRTLSR